MHESGNFTVEDGMIVGKRITFYANDLCMIIDVATGTVLKIGDQTTGPLDSYYETLAKSYDAMGMAEDLKFINFDRYNGILDIDDICTVLNYFTNSIGPEKMNSLLIMNTQQLKIEVSHLQELGF